jgi:hypothetical protein
MNPTTIVNFESFRAYRWLLEIAEPDEVLWRYLRSHDIDLAHTFNMLHGAIARQPYNFDHCFGLGEDAIALPVLEPDDETPLDVCVFSMARPKRFTCLLELGAVLGANAVLNPASHEPCQLVRTPLKWLQAGIQGHACVLDPWLARPLLDLAPGDLAAKDVSHAHELIVTDAVAPERLVIPVEAAA